MDLTLFIVFLIFGLLMYYLIKSIISLEAEIKEIKNKCIKCNNIEFDTNSTNITENFYNNLLDLLNNLQKNYI